MAAAGGAAWTSPARWLVESGPDGGISVVVARVEMVAALRSVLLAGQATTAPLASNARAGNEVVAGAVGGWASPGLGVLVVGRGDDPAGLLARFGGRGLAVAVSVGLATLDRPVFHAAWRPAPGRTARPLGALRIAGAGWRTLRPGPTPYSLVAASPRTVPTSGRWSRMAGALGPVAFEWVRSASVAVVGCGRVGSMLALGLARAGVGSLALIDPDQLEDHSLDAMDLSTSDVGRPKVEAVARAVAAIAEPGATAVEPVAAAVDHPSALGPVARADLIAVCTDDDGGRWAANLAAVLYRRPLVEVGAGVQGEGVARELGADVRLIAPGEGCLVCVGGLANPHEVAALRRGLVTEASRRAARVWHTERRGSLRSLNHLAVGLALRLVEDGAAGHLEGSAWVQLRYGADGLPAVRAQVVEEVRIEGCAVCALGGRGDAGLTLAAGLPDG